METTESDKNEEREKFMHENVMENKQNREERERKLVDEEDDAKSLGDVKKKLLRNVHVESGGVGVNDDIEEIFFLPPATAWIFLISYRRWW
jgi:hypothetical protein